MDSAPEINDNTAPPVPHSKRGRKPKYFSEEDRRMAKREQNRKYRDRKREELIALRRLAASTTAPSETCNTAAIKDEDSSAFRGDIPIEL